MATADRADPAKWPKARVRDDLVLADLQTVLAAGWQDFRAESGFGLFFGGIYLVSGWFLTWVTLVRGDVAWLVPAAAGFPLLAPFCAVGLYEISRRRAARLPLSWGAVLGALRGRGDEQILSVGVILFVGFGFWLMIGHGIFAVFLAESGIGSESLALFDTTAGWLMLVVGSSVGAAIAFFFYAMTVISLPMLVDRNVDFLTAIFTSFSAIKANQVVMTAWAAIVAASLTAALLPAFLGLLVVLPVLGHATWHLYRIVVLPEPAPVLVSPPVLPAA
ncbi:DUF2189 domain-containing protein [Sandarakinorhabdus sp.]|uniref:DUF2189 domain-containing protein n=1 Tax=Sandarakinorhabdus sp. TaxID=1916663 RepID=UPI003340B98E